MNIRRARPPTTPPFCSCGENVPEALDERQKRQGIYRIAHE